MPAVVSHVSDGLFRHDIVQLLSEDELLQRKRDARLDHARRRAAHELLRRLLIVLAAGARRNVRV